MVETPDLRRGTPYDRAAVERELQRWTDRLRARGYYEARASHGVLFLPDGAVVSVTLTQGPLIRVAFAGDPLDEDDRERLVPIRAEASADEDLLEDSARAIEAFLKRQGRRDARVDYDRVPGDNDVVITFTIDRGPRYEVGGGARGREPLGADRRDSPAAAGVRWRAVLRGGARRSGWPTCAAPIGSAASPTSP